MVRTKNKIIGDAQNISEVTFEKTKFQVNVNIIKRKIHLYTVLMCS